MLSDVATTRRLVVDSVAVGLPVQRYFVAATVMKPGRITLANEYALRLLRVVDQVDLKAFQQFFGFSYNEALQLLAELHGKRWVEVQGGSLALSPFGEALFKLNSEESPLIHETAPFRSMLTFETISYAPIQSYRATKAPKNAIVLPEPDSGRDIEALVSATFQDAYNMGFDDGPNQNRGTRAQIVCGVNEVAYRGSDVLEISVPVEFDLNEQNLTYNYNAIDGLATIMDQSRVLAALSERLTNLRSDTNNASSFAFISEFDNGTISAYANQRTGIFNFDAWVESCIDRENRSGIEPFVGSFNKREVRAAFNSALKSSEKSHKQPRTDVICLRPALEHWGRNASMQRFLQNLLEGDAKGPNSFLLSSEDMTTYDFKKHFGPPSRAVNTRKSAGFDAGMVTSRDSFPGGVELLLVGSILGVIVYLQVEGAAPHFPVGFVTGKSEIVNAAKQTMVAHLDPIMLNANVVWSTVAGGSSDILDCFSRALQP